VRWVFDELDVGVDVSLEQLLQIAELLHHGDILVRHLLVRASYALNSIVENRQRSLTFNSWSANQFGQVDSDPFGAIVEVGSHSESTPLEYPVNGV